MLIREIAAYDCDILCLQDADAFEKFWRPNLMLLGYDTVFKQRTKHKTTHDEGVILAYKREAFQLYKTVPVEFNTAAELWYSKGTVFVDRCKSDDVGELSKLHVA
jgi:mRNA deadenylase 3'-5' endonuclease subunit Ccr4